MMVPIEVLILTADMTFFGIGLSQSLQNNRDFEVVGMVSDLKAMCALLEQPAQAARVVVIGEPLCEAWYEVVATIRGIDADVPLILLIGGDPTDYRLRLEAFGGVTVYPNLIYGEYLFAALRVAAQGVMVVQSGLRGDRGLLMPLTPRETDVVRLLAQGLPTLTIAQRLEIGEETVRVHIAAILRKCLATDRHQAVFAALRQGWISCVPTQS